ncbi:GCN5-related N-acetyltransferase [Cylindrospermum sp. NIES-4074]|jgi:ribosomal protein S18 acetylase RimI-like enzyme|nr:GCN5-related N-acetyltransferase [Cylindrospermum sp. NIES-4074]
MNNPQIQFSDRQSEIDLYQLQELFNISAFWAQGRSIEDLSIAIANSDPVVSIWDGEQLIGFSRATSDGIYRATIWDVVIHPDYRGNGLGSKLVETVLSHPRMRVERVYLMTTHQQEFYEKIGFQPNTTTTMVLYNQSNLGSLPTAEIQLQESLGG